MVFVVAEIGVNWDGDFQLVTEMMQRSKENGFDAVKFQSFNMDIVKDHPEKERLMQTAINKNNIDEINNIAKDIGIEWFCTPMYLDAVDLLNPYVNRFKIRVADGRTLYSEPSPLVKKILDCKKETIVSVETPPPNILDYNSIKWLYCVSKYPCPLEDIDFTNLKLFDGYSNHSQNIIAPISAVCLGAEIIEIHVTSDKSKDFVDNSVSFDFSEQKQILNLIRSFERIKK